jgi:hypothetical protein
MVRTRCPASSCQATSWCSTTRLLQLQQQHMQKQQLPCIQLGQAAWLLLVVVRRWVTETQSSSRSVLLLVMQRLLHS